MARFASYDRIPTWKQLVINVWVHIIYMYVLDGGGVELTIENPAL